MVKSPCLGQRKAEAKLAETLKNISEEVKEKVICCRGPMGPRGPKGPAGTNAGAYTQYTIELTPSEKEEVQNLISQLSTRASKGPSCNVSSQELTTFGNLWYNDFIVPLTSLFTSEYSGDTTSLPNGIPTYNLTGSSKDLLIDFLNSCVEYFPDGFGSLVACGFVRLTIEYKSSTGAKEPPIPVLSIGANEIYPNVSSNIYG